MIQSNTKPADQTLKEYVKGNIDRVTNLLTVRYGQVSEIEKNIQILEDELIDWKETQKKYGFS